MKSFPKVMVASANPFNRVNGNGIMMGSLFKGWDKAQLTQIYYPTVADFDCDYSICDRYRRIDIFGRVSSPVVGERRSAPINAHGRLLPKLGRWTELLRELMWAANRSRRKTFPIVECEEPQYLYTPLGSLNLCRLTLELAKRYHLKVVAHFTDNWIDTLYRGSVGESWLRKRLIGYVREVISTASAVLAISPMMADEYCHRFKRGFDCFTTCIESERFGRRKILSTESSGPFRLLYSGGLSIGRASQLELLAETIEAFRPNQCSLEIYSSEAETSRERARFARFGRTKLLGWLDGDELLKRQEAAQVLVHVESFEPAISLYTRLSLSTKITQYMALGKCILAFGPRGLSSIEYVRQHQIGVCVDDEKGDSLRSACEALANQPAMRAECGFRGFRLAQRDHAADVVRRRFRQLFE